MPTEPIIYIVDDDSSVREALESLVRSVGLRAELFRTAQEFLQYKRADAPSCLVLDVRLPGLSGLDLQRELGAAEIPIIFITGHGDIAMSVRAMKAGAVEFLTKPFRDQDLLDAIHQAIERDRGLRSEGSGGSAGSGSSVGSANVEGLAALVPPAGRTHDVGKFGVVALRTDAARRGVQHPGAGPPAAALGLGGLLLGDGHVAEASCARLG